MICNDEHHAIVLVLQFMNFPANMKLQPNAVLILCHRLRRLPSIKTSMGQPFVLAE